MVLHWGFSSVKGPFILGYLVFFILCDSRNYQKTRLFIYDNEYVLNDIGRLSRLREENGTQKKE